MAETTTAQLFSHPYQFLVETVEGTTNGSGTFTVAPPVKSLSIKKDGGWVDVAQIGPEDIAALIEGTRTYETQVVFYSSEAAGDEAFFARAINAADAASPSGTISETFSALVGYYLNGTINYLVMKGTRAKNVAIKMAVGQPHEITIDFVHTTIPVPTTSAPAGTTVSTTFNSDVINSWLSGGASPISLIGVTLDCTEFNCTINRNTGPDHILGSAEPHSTKSHGRRISGDAKYLYTVVTNDTTFDTPTAGTITAVLDTGVSTLTISNANLVTIDKDVGADDTEATIESAGFRARSVSIA